MHASRLPPYRGGMDESSANLSYRSLDFMCRQQAKLADHPKARNEVERMAIEYKRLADRVRMNSAGPPKPPRGELMASVAVSGLPVLLDDEILRQLGLGVLVDPAIANRARIARRTAATCT